MNTASVVLGALAGYVLAKLLTLRKARYARLCEEWNVAVVHSGLRRRAYPMVGATRKSPYRIRRSPNALHCYAKDGAKRAFHEYKIPRGTVLDAWKRHERRLES